MDDSYSPALFFTLAGLVGGIVLFARGLIAYRHDRLISSVATSSLDGIAAGEVRVTGVVEAIDHTLVSPVQSKPCVWYRARIEEKGEHGRVLLNEERGQQFRLRNQSGEIRVIPRGARWEIGTSYDESTGLMGEDPPGLHLRHGSVFGTATDRDPEQMTDAEQEMARQALLSVKRPNRTSSLSRAAGADWAVAGFGGGGFGDFGTVTGNRGTRYREARVEIGETITILGQALPWADVRERLHAWDPGSNVETAIAADVARARELGMLAASPEEAWGNAAIPGFGIGAPTTTPELDPEARPQEGLGSEAHERAMARYDIPDAELVLSRGERGEMAVYAGAPSQATMHHDFAFALGVMGAIMAVVSALGLGAVLTGNL